MTSVHWVLHGPTRAHHLARTLHARVRTPTRPCTRSHAAIVAASSAAADALPPRQPLQRTDSKPGVLATWWQDSLAPILLYAYADDLAPLSMHAHDDPHVMP